MNGEVNEPLTIKAVLFDLEGALLDFDVEHPAD
jgi:hypothetical protein